MIIRIVQSKGRKDRNVMLPAEVLELCGILGDEVIRRRGLPALG
jgi:hypothetical protein